MVELRFQSPPLLYPCCGCKGRGGVVAERQKNPAPSVCGVERVLRYWAIKHMTKVHFTVPLVCCLSSHSFLKCHPCKTFLHPRQAQGLPLCSHSTQHLPLPRSSYFIRVVTLSSSPDHEFLWILEEGTLIHDLLSASSVLSPMDGTPGTSVCL